MSRPLPLERSGARLLGAFEQTRSAGYYTVEAPAGRADLLKAATLGFAVNLAPEESDFTLLGGGRVPELLPPGVELTFVDATRRRRSSCRRHGQGPRGLWRS